MQQRRYAGAVDAEQPFGRMRRLRESFEEWHRLSIAASQRGDLAALADAMHAETDLIREQVRVMDELKDPRRSREI